MATEYWLRGDIPSGPIKATVITDISRVADILKKFRGYTLIVVGPGVKDIEMVVGGDILEQVIEIAKSVDASIVTSDSDIVKRFDEKEFKNYRILSPLEAIRYIVRNQIHYKLVVFVGLKYAYEWLLLNTLKHYRPEIQTLSIDPFAQPNAVWTLPSLPLPMWHKNITQLIQLIKRG
ncbi:MAG: carbon monoxide dehydrogenase beta subunit family protein [Ignisphaera sp.]|uniref:CO dehydrogenase/acetyl-CoA synthase complex subunit epsilon n=1 Tax=Ignisphaera aggregans TaxID=334771 RepID=A0A7C4JLA3_9CREN